MHSEREAGIVASLSTIHGYPISHILHTSMLRKPFGRENAELVGWMTYPPNTVVGVVVTSFVDTPPVPS